MNQEKHRTRSALARPHSNYSRDKQLCVMVASLVFLRSGRCVSLLPGLNHSVLQPHYCQEGEMPSDVTQLLRWPFCAGCKVLKCCLHKADACPSCTNHSQYTLSEWLLSTQRHSFFRVTCSLLETPILHSQPVSTNKPLKKHLGISNRN